VIGTTLLAASRPTATNGADVRTFSVSRFGVTVIEASAPGMAVPPTRVWTSQPAIDRPTTVSPRATFVDRESVRNSIV
jgi:hypothetical protein